MYNVLSLNEVKNNKVVMLEIFIGIALLLAGLVLLFTDPASAESFIGTSGKSLLSDLSYWIALGVVGFGIFSIVKGRMAIGIIGIVVGAVIFAFAMSPDLFGTFGNKIVNIFLGTGGGK